MQMLLNFNKNQGGLYYMAKLNVEVFADGADIEEMKAAYKNKTSGWLYNKPSLMAKAGVTDYKSFAEEAVKESSRVSNFI